MNSPEVYGTFKGEEILVYTLNSENGIIMNVIPYGGIIQSLHIPDKNGKLVDVALGFDNFDDYVERSPYFGCIIGRYANRISEAKFTLNEKVYQLEQNDGPNSLHAGSGGFHARVWKVEEVSSSNITFSYTSKDMEEGFPGNLKVLVSYTLTKDNELKIDYKASTDKTTHCCLTQHTYFNLNGDGTVSDHVVSIDAEQYTPVDKAAIPTGKIASVENTIFDLRQPIKLSEAFAKNDNDFSNGGYDHNFVLGGNGSLAHASTVYSAKSGIQMDVFTTEPGIQFYTGNFLDGSLKGKNKAVYPKQGAICLEAQHYPDSPNNPNFPSTVLEPGDEYRQTTVYKFAVV